MFLSVPLRRFKIYFLRRSYSKYGRDDDTVPLTFQECIDKPIKKTFCKPYIIVLLIVPIIFYMFYYKGERKPQPKGFFEIFPKKKIEKVEIVTGMVEKKVEIVTGMLEKKVAIVTESVPVLTQIFNVSQPSKGNLEKWREVQELMEKQSVMMPPNGKKKKEVTNCVITRTGNVTITTKVDETMLLENKFPDILLGGSYTPKKCHPKYRVVIIVPYRDRAKQLSVFLYNIHLFLMRQKLAYRIYVVEQFGTDQFNRGRLLNAGFLEVQKMGRWKCVVFHDVDLLPLDDRISYSCFSVPKHMCATVIGQENVTTSRTLFGGVSSMTAQQFKKVNGFSNLYWGLGGEDNDLFWRFKTAGLGVARLTKDVAKFMTLSTSTHPLNPHRYQLLSTATERYHRDGLNNIRYAVKSYGLRHFYTHVVVDINPKKLNISTTFFK